MVAYSKDLLNAFQSQRLVYRALEDNEADRAFATNLFNDPVNEAMNLGRAIQPLRGDEIEELMKRSETSLMLVVACLKDGEGAGSTSTGPYGLTNGHKMAVGSTPIGIVRLFDPKGGANKSVLLHRTATMGILLAEGHRGKGYGGEMTHWTLDWAFRRGNLHRVELDCYSYNPNSLKLWRKLGFVEEGRRREAIYYDHGWHDVISFGILDHEWETLWNIESQSGSLNPEF
ncbi:acyl-CoA N-acyltransferase [Xylariales sp. PMI_506]|nr:acyl-CoA N-acyltransferase [Xylariales sp. PMI_506]